MKNPRFIEGDGVKPIDEVTDSGNPTLIGDVVPIWFNAVETSWTSDTRVEHRP